LTERPDGSWLYHEVEVVTYASDYVDPSISITAFTVSRGSCQRPGRGTRWWATVEVPTLRCEFSWS
jgi:hypothetical protein